MVPRGETGSRAWVGAEGPGPRHGLQLSPAARAVRRACPRVGVPCAQAPPQSLRHGPDACALCSAKVPDALGGNSVFPEASARASGSGTGQRSGDLWREHVCVSLRWLVPSAGPRPAPRGRTCPPRGSPAVLPGRTLPAGKSPDTQRENAKARAHGGPPASSRGPRTWRGPGACTGRFAHSRRRSSRGAGAGGASSPGTA